MKFKISAWQPWDLQGKFKNRALVVIIAWNERKRLAILHGILNSEEYDTWCKKVKEVIDSGKHECEVIPVEHRWRMDDLRIINNQSKAFDKRHKSINRFIETVKTELNQLTENNAVQQSLNI